MKTETLFWIILGGLFIIGFICILIILKKQGKAPKAIKVGKIILTSMGLILYFIFYYPDRTHYSLSLECSDWEEFNVPHIDTMMYLSRWSNNTQRYETWCTDSIRHQSKEIEKDIFGVYKIKDVFINKKKNLRFVMIYIKPNILRKEQRINYTEKTVNYNNVVKDTLNIKQTDSLLIQWGFSNELFKDTKEYYR